MSKPTQKLVAALLSFLADSKPLYVRRRPAAAAPLAPEKIRGRRLVLDVDGVLLLPGGLFPYFMLVAVEAGGFLRGLLLLLLYPLLLCLAGEEVKVRAMAFVAFVGLTERRVARAGRGVLPKWLMDRVSKEGFAAARLAGRRRCVSLMPRVMVEPFLKDYLEVESVAAPEMMTWRGVYTGVLINSVAGDREDDDVALCASPEFAVRHPAKDVFVVSGEERARWTALARSERPKPVVFHDGRLAFFPSAGSALAMFLYLPFGLILAAVRLAVALLLPYRLSTPILAMTGMKWTLKGAPPATVAGEGQLFVCNHRTLIDPIYVSVALNKPVRAVVYSLSSVSEWLSPIRTVRLTRNRERDGGVMAEMLRRGELVVVCPEGTTCREPFLLRFSPLFAELSDAVVPVALAVRTSMFYATTAGGWKCFDPLFYLMNPAMCYDVSFLDAVDTSAFRARAASSIDAANAVQAKLGAALGFGCTTLTRKDKYMMLAGNDGVVGRN